jgi:hypothetical protein
MNSIHERRLSRLKRRVRAWGKAMDGLDERKYRLQWIRLSYAPGVVWEANDIREFMQKLRKNQGDDLAAYCWVAELYADDRIHYHVYVVLRRGHKNIPMPDKSGMWEKGNTSLRSPKGLSWAYLASNYGSKGDQKRDQYPRGLRMFAVWCREGVLSGVEYVMFRLSVYPQWLREKVVLAWAKRGVWHRVLLPYRDEFGYWWVGRMQVRCPWRVSFGEWVYEG